MNFVTLGFIFLTVINVSFSSSLYSPEDPLWELDDINFKKIVYGKNKAWIIQFYNSWCGHCIRFSPTWKLFARDTQMWRKVIDVGAVNCNDAKNVKLCRHYDVQSYPTIKLFWHNINESDLGEDLVGKRDIISMEESIIKFLESNWDKGVPQNWPDITALKSKSINEVKSLPMNNEGIYLFIEDEESFVGREAILDLSFQTNVILRRVLDTNTELLNDLGPALYNGTLPVIIKVDRSGNKEVLMRFPSNITAIEGRDQMFQLIVGHPRGYIAKNASLEETSTQIAASDSVYMVDLENAVYYALSQEIGVSKVIEGEKFSTLKSFLSILKSYFPGSPSVMAYLSNLYNWVSYKKRSTTGEEFVKTMDQLQNEREYLPKMRDWIGCKGSTSRFRGYPCSLWTLFHTLTVQADKEFIESHGNSETAAQVLFGIRDYIKNFFTCHECVDNFNKMALNMENEVNSSQNAVLWLWEAHNKANRRLSGDVTEDPKHPKVQFPPSKLCPECRISGQSFEDTVWDRTQVIQFLHRFYAKENIRSSDSLKADDSFSANLSNASMGLKVSLTADLAVLLLFYFLSKLM